MTLWLSQQEIDDLCEPLTQPAAQIRYLRDSLKLTVRAKPNGRALLLRSHVEEILGGLLHKKPRQKPAEAGRQPNSAGLVLAFQKG